MGSDQSGSARLAPRGDPDQSAVEITAGLLVRVLGPVAAEVAGVPVRLGPTHRLLLAVLVLHAGRPVPASRLVRLLWGEPPAAGANSTLRSHVARLRRILEPGRAPRGTPCRLVTDAAGYALRLEEDQVDSRRFEALVAQGRRATDPAAAVDCLRAALRLWRGPALADLADRPFAINEARRLDELRRAALHACLEAELDRGGHTEVVGELSGLVAELPRDEGLRRLLALALYRCGRPEEAAQACQDGLVLLHEHGLDSPELSTLQRDILRRSAALDPLDPPPPAPTHPRQLPPDLVDFTGRAAEVAALTAALTGRGARPAFVAGPAGVGKSALAVHVAHRLHRRFPAGELYVNLRGSDARPADPAEVLGRFLRALGVDGAGVPAEPDERAVLYRSLLAERRVLVVLDNAADERQVEPLLPGSATCGVLVTGRARLTGLAGAVPVELAILSTVEAVELLGRIAGAARVAAEPRAARELAELCGRLPLALRVAGARLAARPHRPLAQLAHRLADEHRRLDELSYRGMEVRASLLSSYRELAASERILLRRLGLLDAPDVAAWTAAALLDVAVEDAEESLDRLVEAQLVDVVGRYRYHLHDLVRIFARERAEREEPDAARDAALARAIGGWLGLAEQAHCAWCGGNFLLVHGNAPRWLPDAATVGEVVAAPLAWLEAERLAIAAAVRQAARTGLDELCWDLAVTATTLYRARSYYDDWRDTHEQALATADGVGRAAVLVGLGELYLSTVDYQRAGSCLDEAVRLFTAAGHAHGVGLAEYLAAAVDRHAGRLDAARDRYERVRHAFAGAGDRGGEVYALRSLAQVEIDGGDAALAVRYLEQALGIATDIGHDRFQQPVLYWLGEARLRLGQHGPAVVAFQRALELTRRTGNRVGEPYALCGLGLAYLGQGDLDRAGSWLDEALDVSRAVDDRYAEARIRHARGEWLVARGQYPAAVVDLVAALASWREFGNVLWQARTLRLLADAHHAAGDAGSAAAARTEAEAPPEPHYLD